MREGEGKNRSVLLILKQLVKGCVCDSGCWLNSPFFICESMATIMSPVSTCYPSLILWSLGVHTDRWLNRQVQSILFLLLLLQRNEGTWDTSSCCSSFFFHRWSSRTCGRSNRKQPWKQLGCCTPALTYLISCPSQRHHSCRRETRGEYWERKTRTNERRGREKRREKGKKYNFPFEVDKLPCGLSVCPLWLQIDGLMSHCETVRKL